MWTRDQYAGQATYTTAKA